LHHTIRGKSVPTTCNSTHATKQFEISDDRSPSMIASRLVSLGLEPVWKDWDSVILT
jgi:2-iminoacetate synthase